MTRVLRRLLLVLALTAGLAAHGAAAPAAAEAASCVRITGGNFDAPGNDNLAANLNGEWVRIKNYCAVAAVLTGWRLHDYGTKHTYFFRTGQKIGPAVTMTLYTGRGTNTATKLFWGRTYGAVWNNTPPERAYLRNGARTVVSSWSPYR